jgi:secreted trypsin-like serine protease
MRIGKLRLKHWRQRISAILCGLVPLSLSVSCSNDVVLKGSSVVGANVVVLVASSAPSNDLITSQFCNAVRISSDTVLTAWHCVATRGLNGFDIVLAPQNLCYPDVNVGVRAKPISVQKIPSAVDVAAVQFRIPDGLMSDDAAEVTPNEDVNVGQSLVAVGFGSVSLMQPESCTIQPVPLTAAAAGDCVGMNLADSEFCAIPPAGAAGNTCPGFSGGPVYRVGADGRSVVLVGIVSRGLACGPSDAGVYEKIPDGAWGSAAPPD